MLCQRHCKEAPIALLFEKFKKEVLKSSTWSSLRLSFFSKSYTHNSKEVKIETVHVSKGNDVKRVYGDGLFLLQVIDIDGKKYNTFYDDCYLAVFSKKCVDKLEDRFLQPSLNPIKIWKKVSRAKYRLHQIKIPLVNSLKNAVLVGPVMDDIT